MILSFEIVEGELEMMLLHQRVVRISDERKLYIQHYFLRREMESAKSCTT